MKYLLGADKLHGKLAGLTGAEAKAAFRRGTRAGAKLVAAATKEKLPSVSGTLEKGVKVRAMKRSRKRLGSTCTVIARDKKGVSYVAAWNYGHGIGQRTSRRQGVIDTRQKVEGARILNEVADAKGGAALAVTGDAIQAEILKRATA